MKFSAALSTTKVTPLSPAVKTTRAVFGDAKHNRAFQTFFMAALRNHVLSVEM
jgi:hypothetical protein